MVERDYVSWQRTAKDRRWLQALFDGVFGNVPFAWELKMADTESDINWLNRGLQVDDDGNLWVLPSRGTREQPAGVVATFDVFTPDGVFDRQVQVACEGTGEKDGVFLLGTDRVMIVKGFVDAMATMFGGGRRGRRRGRRAHGTGLLPDRAVTDLRRYERIYLVVAAIPRGSVATYGQVADLAGLPGRARLVGRALGELPERHPAPWYRVVGAGGRSAPGATGRPRRSSSCSWRTRAWSSRLRAASTWRGSAGLGDARACGAPRVI